MTNENAIMRLMLVRHRNDNTDMLNEALDMAIEALQRGLENVNADSCSEKPNESEPKTAESGSVDSEMPEIKTDRTIGGMIYRQDAIDALMNDVTPYGLMDDEGNIASGCKDKDVIAMLYNLPSAQPERKKGEWIENSPVTEKCDQCGYVIRDWFVSQFNFCPNCGAFMMEDDGK